MKKVFYSLFALCTVFAISCQKELGQDSSNNTNDGVIPDVIIGEINPDDASTNNEVFTKTQYAENTTFGWSASDKIRMPLVKTSGGTITQCDFYTFAGVGITDGDVSATFNRNVKSVGDGEEVSGFDPNPSGADNTWTSMGYLVYPTTSFNKDYYGNKPVIILPTSIAWSASTPLDGGVVPMIGRKDGESYKFSTAVGFIKVHLTNVSADANKIKLVSSNKYIAGKFAISDVDATVSQIANDSATDGTRELTLTGLSLTAGNAYDFYFPVPVGNYPANTLSVIALDANNVPLLEKTIAKALTIERNQVLGVPELPYHRVYVDGKMSAPTLHTVKPSSASMIRVHITSDKLDPASYQSTVWKDGNRFSDPSASYNCASLTNKSGIAFLSNPGMYYLQYIVLKSGYTGIPSSLADDNVLIYGSVPFYYAPAGNKIPVAASWLDVPYVSTSEGAVANLVDGATNTYWHSPYGSEDPARNATYGQIISIDLNEGSLTTDGNFYFSFATRNVQNDHAKVLNIYVSNVRWDESGFDAEKVKVGSTTNALEGIWPYSDTWIKNPIVCSGTGSYRYITVSILNTWGETRSYDLTSSGCTHMAEIEFYTR